MYPLIVAVAVIAWALCKQAMLEKREQEKEK
jgi:uncharacterized membrane protein